MRIGCYEEKEYSKKLLEIKNMIAEMKTFMVGSEGRTEMSESRAKKKKRERLKKIKKIGEAVQRSII